MAIITIITITEEDRRRRQRTETRKEGRADDHFRGSFGGKAESATMGRARSGQGNC